MTKQELEKFKTKLRKNFIKMITSSQYQIPADTAEKALIKWLEVSIAFDSTVRDLKLEEE